MAGVPISFGSNATPASPIRKLFGEQTKLFLHESLRKWGIRAWDWCTCVAVAVNTVSLLEPVPYLMAPSTGCLQDPGPEGSQFSRSKKHPKERDLKKEFMKKDYCKDKDGRIRFNSEQPQSQKGMSSMELDGMPRTHDVVGEIPHG